MRNYIARRFQTAQDSVMASAAAEKGAYSDLIDLSIGDTDFTTDERIIRAAMEDALSGHTHYTSPQGDPELIDEIRTYYKTAHNMDLTREQVFISASSCFGMELALMSILDPGDEVILFAPYFSPYKEQVELTGGVAVEVPCLEEEGFAINAQRLRASITPRTKAMIVNNPCNPTGAAYDLQTYRTLAQVAEEFDLVVILDEIYTDYMFEEPFRPFRGLPGMAQRSITLNSFSKNYIMTGWRVGSIIAEPAVIDTIKRINENMVYSAPSVSQRAAIHALRLRSEIGDKYTGEYRRRVFYTAERINAIPKLSVREPQGTFYLFMNIKQTGLDSIAFCQKCVKEAHVAMVPGVAFGAAGEGYVRIACTTSEEKLGEAFDRIAALKF